MSTSTVQLLTVPLLPTRSATAAESMTALLKKTVFCTVPFCNSPMRAVPITSME